MGLKYTSVYKSEKWERMLTDYYDAALKNWPMPYEELFVETETAKTHIIICGKPEGKPLLMFHGTGNNSLMWRYNVENLGKKYRLYLIDTPNDPGKSAMSSAFKPPEGYSKWMKELLDELKLGKVSVLSHSKGGWIALNTVIYMPEKISPRRVVSHIEKRHRISLLYVRLKKRGKSGIRKIPVKSY